MAAERGGRSDPPTPPDTLPPGLHVELGSAGEPDRLPVVLVHGSLDSSRSFARLRHACATTRRIATYDRRGYQRSRAPGHAGPTAADGGTEPRAGTAASLEDHVDDLLAVVGATLGVDEHPGDGDDLRRPATAVVLGHSYGAVVALAAVERHSGLIAGVLAYEPPLSWFPWWPSGATGTTLVPAPGEDGAGFAERFARTMLGDRRYEQLRADTRLSLARDGPQAAAELAELVTRPAFEPERIDVPVTVVRGSLTAERHLRATDWLAASLGTARLVVVDGAGHGGHISHPKQLARLLDEVARDAGELPAKDGESHR